MTENSKSKMSRAEARDLDLEIQFLEGLTRRDPEFVEALQLLGEDYTRRGKIGQGLQVDLTLARLRPQDPMIHYNLACSYSLMGQHEAAYQALNRALDQGYRDFRWLTRDPDLAQFRAHPLYRKLRARVRTLRVKVR